MSDREGEWAEHLGKAASKASREIDRLRAREAVLVKTLTAAGHALRSYEYGNASKELAKGIADEIDKALATISDDSE